MKLVKDDYSYHGQSIRLNIISEGSELALEANGLFYELAYTHI